MSFPRGRRLPLSPSRRLVADLMWACRGVPAVAVDRRVDLSELIAARRAATIRPMWTVIFAKAYARVLAAEPLLRCSYMGFPWPHLYEHAEPVPALTVEREHNGESIVFVTRLRGAHKRPLAELDAEMRHAKEAPLDGIRALHRTRRLMRLPRPLRRMAMWLALQGSGRLRERHCGTFGLTSVAAEGAGAFHVLTPMTTTLHYGLFDNEGRIDLRLTFDHRAFDGAVVARGMISLERVLRGEILDELRQLPATAKAA